MCEKHNINVCIFEQIGQLSKPLRIQKKIRNWKQLHHMLWNGHILPIISLVNVTYIFIFDSWSGHVIVYKYRLHSVMSLSVTFWHNDRPNKVCCVKTYLGLLRYIDEATESFVLIIIEKKIEFELGLSVFLWKDLWIFFSSV